MVMHLFCQYKAKKQHPIGCCFFIELVRSRSLSPLAGEIRPQAPKSNSREGVAFLFETATRYIAHEMPISGHNCRSMRNYRSGISVKRSISSREHHFLSNAVAGCRTKMLVFDKLPLHLLSVCGIFDSVLRVVVRYVLVFISRVVLKLLIQANISVMTLLMFLKKQDVSLSFS